MSASSSYWKVISSNCSLIGVWHSRDVDRRKKWLVALWTAFGVFWVFLAAMTAINPVLEPAHGPPLILILQMAVAALCGLVVIRIIRSQKP